MSAPLFGVDYAWGRPGIPALKAAGVKFVCRYLSHDTSGKNLTKAEADQLTAAGIAVVLVWETTANRALVGRVGGVQDAMDAAVKAKACGQPADRPIFFAVDWDANQSQQVRINAYLDGAASVLGVERVGIYGGFGPVKRALDGGHAKWGWQTYAWSDGKWDDRAQLRQYSNDEEIGGVGLDFDHAMVTDYGQWPKPKPKPKPPVKPTPPARSLSLKTPPMSGQDVRDAQKALNTYGAKPRLNVDGRYGPLTVEAVKAFQKKRGLKVDGIVGPITRASLLGAS